MGLGRLRRFFMPDSEGSHSKSESPRNFSYPIQFPSHPKSFVEEHKDQQDAMDSPSAKNRSMYPERTQSIRHSPSLPRLRPPVPDASDVPEIPRPKTASSVKARTKIPRPLQLHDYCPRPEQSPRERYFSGVRPPSSPREEVPPPPPKAPTPPPKAPTPPPKSHRRMSNEFRSGATLAVPGFTAGFPSDGDDARPVSSSGIPSVDESDHLRGRSIQIVPGPRSNPERSTESCRRTITISQTSSVCLDMETEMGHSIEVFVDGKPRFKQQGPKSQWHPVSKEWVIQEDTYRDLHPRQLTKEEFYRRTGLTPPMPSTPLTSSPLAIQARESEIASHASAADKRKSMCPSYYTTQTNTTNTTTRTSEDSFSSGYCSSGSSIAGSAMDYDGHIEAELF